jgi:cytochrome b561
MTHSLQPICKRKASLPWQCNTFSLAVIGVTDGGRKQNWTKEMTKTNGQSFSLALMDSPRRYGLVSRVLHWGMAYLLIWQFASLLMWRFGGQADWVEIVTSFGPYHGTIGLLTMVSVILRAVWAFINRQNRPPPTSGWMGHAARAGHLLLYCLMFVIPALALLRSYGSGKGWKQWGLQLVPETGIEIGWMIVPANALHGVLAWILSATIAGHVIMALFHQMIREDHKLATMLGPLVGASKRSV